MHESRQSGWGKAHGVVFTTMVLVGVFLLTTQNELWQSSAGYVTTALGRLRHARQAVEYGSRRRFGGEAQFVNVRAGRAAALERSGA